MEDQMHSAITSKGQATIPKPVRDHLNLKPGDRIKFFIDPYGGVVIMPVLPITALKGMVPRPTRPVSIEDMNEAIAAGAAGEPLPDGEP
jgi:antitoxin PrlF